MTTRILYSLITIIFLSALTSLHGDSGGVSDAVQNGKTGILVHPDKPEDIASAIKLLLTDNNLARRYGNEGRRWTETQMSWEQVAERLVNAIHRMK